MARAQSSDPSDGRTEFWSSVGGAEGRQHLAWRKAWEFPEVVASNFVLFVSTIYISHFYFLVRLLVNSA